MWVVIFGEVDCEERNTMGSKMLRNFTLEEGMSWICYRKPVAALIEIFGRARMRDGCAIGSCKSKCELDAISKAHFVRYEPIPT